MRLNAPGVLSGWCLQVPRLSYTNLEAMRRTRWPWLCCMCTLVLDAITAWCVQEEDAKAVAPALPHSVVQLLQLQVGISIILQTLCA